MGERQPLTRQMVVEVFKELMPNTLVVPVDHEAYIKDALGHPFIQQQMSVGIYDEESIKTDFLSVAKSFANERAVEIDVDLILSHMDGVDLQAALGYVAHVALHEYHHIENHGGPPLPPAAQMMREVECDEYLRREHAEVMRLAEQATEQSTTIQRVYRRMAGLRS